MDIFLVTASDYDYALIDSAWATLAEAEGRIAEAQANPDAGDYTSLHSYNFRVKVVKLGEVIADPERFRL